MGEGRGRGHPTTTGSAGWTTVAPRFSPGTMEVLKRIAEVEQTSVTALVSTLALVRLSQLENDEKDDGHHPCTAIGCKRKVSMGMRVCRWHLRNLI